MTKSGSKTSLKAGSKKTKKSTEDGAGNTKNTAPKEYRSLTFTLNNWTEDEKDGLLEWFESRKKLSYIFQEETGEEDGTPHLQGVFKSQSPIKWDFLKKKFPRMHFEKTKSWDKSVKYCSKEETRTGKVYKSADIKVTIKQVVKNPLDGKKLYPYQKQILKWLRTEPDERTVHWYWEETGNVGKSALVKSIFLTYKDEVVIANGKGNDVRNQINMHINGDPKKEIEGKNLRIAILDISRTVEDYVSYEVIEQIKNGLLYSGKYEGGVCCFNSPHVIIFANFKPKMDTLSTDRWRIYQINEDCEAMLDTDCESS